MISITTFEKNPCLMINKKLEEFEGLRAVLAMWVVVFHVFSISGLHVPALLDGGNAVSVFFALSGFVIAMLLNIEKETYPAFIVRRFFRIFPAYFICVAGSLILVLYGFMPKTYEDNSMSAHILLHLLMLHGVLPVDWLTGADSAFLNPAWSITVEWQFYLIIPAFFILLRSRPSMAWLLIIVTAAISRRILLPLFEMGGGSLLAHFHIFVYGIISFFIFDWSKKNVEIFRPFARILPIACPLLILPVIAISQNVGLLVWLFFFGAAISVRADNALEPIVVFINVLRSRPLTWLGAISYALYLVHEPIVWLSLHAVHYYFPYLNVNTCTVLVGFLSVPISIGAAYALHIFVELPFIKIGKNWTEKFKSRSHKAATKKL